MAARRLVNFLDNSDDLETLVLGQLGFSTRYIQRKTRLTKCQVLYRLGKGKTKRSDYREGNSPSAFLVMRMASITMARQIRAKMQAERKSG